MNRTFSRTLNGAYDCLLPIFRNINEKFFWGFVALDTTGLWPGRFITGLLAGRKEYDTRKDPEAQKLPLRQQIKRAFSRNWQGLNWPNCWEEVKREMIVAPGGILMIPSVAFLVGRKFLGRLIEIPFKTMKALGEGFSEHLQSSLPGNQANLTEAAFRKTVADHFTGLFADPLLEKTPLDDPALRAQLAKLPSMQEALAKAGRQEPTYADFLRHRFQAWADLLFDKNLDKKELQKKLEPLAKEIQEQLLLFNRTHRMTPYQFLVKGMEKAEEVLNPSLFSDHTWVALSGSHPPKAQPIGGLLESLTQWGEFPRKLWQSYDAAGGAYSLAEASEGLLKQSIARKGLVVFSLMALSTAWLISLTKFAQSSKTYQATRNLRKGADTSGSPAALVPPSVGMSVPYGRPSAAFCMVPGQSGTSFNRPLVSGFSPSSNAGGRF